jgi:predicted metal-dependent HD superfamily phosphohydrolase
MLCGLDDVRYNLTGYEKNVLITAILFHDIVYIPGTSDNEEQSVEYFKHSELTGFDTFNTNVSELIMSTKYHNKGVNNLSDIMIDLDMMILGHSRKEYDVYIQQIRNEYKNIPDDKFYLARLSFLQSLYCEDYFTSFYSGYNETLNMNMKNNIDTEISQIKSRLGVV